MRKKILSALLLSIALMGNAKAQQLLGVSTSNYAGTHGIYMNPSSIADSRYGFYLNLFAFDTHFSNDYLRYNPDGSLLKSYKSYNSGETEHMFNEKFVEERLNGKPKMVSTGFDFRGPSFMLKMSPKHSFAITTRARTFIQGSNISEDMARLIKDGSDENDLLNKSSMNQQFSMDVNSVAEAGFTYARTILEKDKHFLKGGFTVKRLLGFYSGYINNQDFNYTLKENAMEETYLDVQNVDVKFGYSGMEFDIEDNINFSKIPGKGWGYDLGFTYEFRPDIDDYRYTMDGKERLDNRKNKYKFRLGVALMDMGGLTYQDPKSVHAYDINRKNIEIRMQDIENSDGDYAEAISQALSVQPSEQKTSFRTSLSTALNINFDYHLVKKLYVNATLIKDVKGKNGIGMQQNSMFAITPRLEMKGLELAFPLSLQNNYKDFAVGTMLKLGPLFVGSDNIGGIFGIGKIFGANAYAGLAIPIFKGKKKDKDQDGVSNGKDLCKTVPGVWEFKGCPDSDGDGIQDKDDLCPTQSGVKEFNGCPDTDKDGIKDSEDKCPTEAGLAQFNGCPDTDSDSIIDSEDACPTEAGIAKFNGCPDKDEDDVMDKEDACPEVKGLPRFKGCPDSDEDGIQDKEDACPQDKGSAALKGCPDRDADGVADKDDKCPDVAGIVANNGCPEVKAQVAPQVEVIELTQEEQKVLKEAFDNLEFETGKAIITAGSLASLDELAELLQTKKEYRLKISGHTDNVGKPATNLKLSKDRAAAVKKHLVSKGVSSERIITEGFGSAKPVATNKTAVGRQKNRRVEMKVIK